jgi:peptidoglycan/xylan/chitin deacetylase (PgdA/CDA1 family)
MWSIAVPALILVTLIATYLHWRIFLRPYISGTIRCFLVHDVVDRLSYRSASEISIDRFRFFVDEALDSGFSFVAPDVFFSQETQREILLTFDDGFDSVYRHVYPILKERQIPALVFTVDSYAGRSPGWDYHTSGRKHLTQDQLSEMRNSGLVTIGSHSATHPDLTKVSQERLRMELTRSGSDSPLYVSYPFGRFSPQVVEVVKAAGFRKGFISLNGRASLWDRQYAVPRMPLNILDNRITMKTKLRGGRLYWCEVFTARLIGFFAPLTYEWRGRP